MDAPTTRQRILCWQPGLGRRGSRFGGCALCITAPANCMVGSSRSAGAYWNRGNRHEKASLAKYRQGCLKDSPGNFARGVSGFEGAVGGDAALDVEGAVGCDVDAKLEQLVDSALFEGGGVGEAGFGGREVLWLVEVGLVGGGLLLPQVEMV